MTATTYPLVPISSRVFWQALLVNMIWINLSEVFRYFVFVMPMMRDALPMVENVAPMSWSVFAIWGVWDTILVFCVTGFMWMYLERFGLGLGNAIRGATFVWLGIFVILWLGIYNMNLATLAVVGVALVFSWIEMVVAALIVNRFLSSNR